MPFGGYYRLVGDEIVECPDLVEWSKWFETAERHIALARVGEFWVSTVFLGIDHGLEGAPLLFETMVFSGGYHVEYEGVEQRRYGTAAEARLGHAEIVRSITLNNARSTR